MISFSRSPSCWRQRIPGALAQFGVVAGIHVAVKVGRVEDGERKRVDGEGKREKKRPDERAGREREAANSGLL